jgi:hypothetical protein
VPGKSASKSAIERVLGALSANLTLGLFIPVAKPPGQAQANANQSKDHDQ